MPFPSADIQPHPSLGKQCRTALQIAQNHTGPCERRNWPKGHLWGDNRCSWKLHRLGQLGEALIGHSIPASAGQGQPSHFLATGDLGPWDACRTLARHKHPAIGYILCNEGNPKNPKALLGVPPLFYQAPPEDKFSLQSATWHPSKKVGGGGISV